MPRPPSFRLRCAASRSGARRRGALALALSTALALLAPGAALAASRRLSQGLPFSDVSGSLSANLKVSPDGRYAIYLQDAVVDEAYELWSVPLAGGDPVRLSGLLPAASGVEQFDVTADSQRVVFISPQESTESYELYSIPIAGPEGAWTKLNPPLPAGASVVLFRIAQEAGRVVYVAQGADHAVYDLWSVPVSGGTALRLRPTVTVPGSGWAQTGDLWFGAGGARVDYLANYANLDKQELWSAPLSGIGSVVKVSRSLVTGGDVVAAEVSPDGTRIVYLADAAVDGRRELWSAPFAGGASVRLNGAMVAGGNVSLVFGFTPEGSRVLYVADQQTDEQNELYIVPADGGTIVKLNPPLAPAADIGYFVVSSDGSRVLFDGDLGTDGIFTLWSVAAAGGAAVEISGPMESGGRVGPGSFLITPGDAEVVYSADAETYGVEELYVVPIGGGAVTKISDARVQGGCSEMRLSPVGPFVFYLGEGADANRLELFRASYLDGPEADVRLNGELVAGGGVGARGGPDFVLVPDGLRALYVADQEVDGRADLELGDVCLLCDGFESGDFARWQ